MPPLIVVRNDSRNKQEDLCDMPSNDDTDEHVKQSLL